MSRWSGEDASVKTPPEMNHRLALSTNILHAIRGIGVGIIVNYTAETFNKINEG